jgi:hypothetical protein
LFWLENKIKTKKSFFLFQFQIKLTNPLKEDIFLNNEEFEKALNMRLRMCDKHDHEGERLLPFTTEYFYADKG